MKSEWTLLFIYIILENPVGVPRTMARDGQSRWQGQSCQFKIFQFNFINNGIKG